MYTKTDISLGLEERIKHIGLITLDALTPRDEMRGEKIMRFRDIFQWYKTIIRDLPMREEYKRVILYGGGLDIFSGDYRNAKLLLEVTFGNAVAGGAHSLFPPEQKCDLEKLKNESLILVPPRPISAWTCGTNRLSGNDSRLPPSIETYSLVKYGKCLGYEYNQVGEVRLMFERIKSLELQSPHIKY